MSQSLLERKWLLNSLTEDSNTPTSNTEKTDTTSNNPPDASATASSTPPAATPTTTTTTSAENDPSKMTEKAISTTPAPTAPMAPNISVSSSNRLAQEIYDEFLVCKICLDGYKNPKCLDCLHTFCEACIETHVNSEPAYKKYSDYREFTCPLCRKRTQLPVGGVKKLPDNFLVSSLTEVVGRQKPSLNPFCDICKLVLKTEKEATSKCLDCTKLLCASCVALHKTTKVTSNHSLFDVEIEKEIGCKDHQDEVIRFYCEPCETCVCVLCTFNEHRDHTISQFQDVAVKYKQNIETLLESCKQKISLFETHLEQINKCETTVKQVEQKIRDKSIEFIQDIRNKEKQLLEQLHQLYGQECFECIDAKKELVHQVENIRNTCNISEVILLGKEIELLLLKKDVEDKLNLMNQIEARQLPATIAKAVEFQSGLVDLGYLVHEKDEPGESTGRALVLVRARKVENGKPTSRWLSTTVDSNKDDRKPLAEGVAAAVKIPSGDEYELAEVCEFAVQTDFPTAPSEVSTPNGSTGDIDEGDLLARRRRRREDAAAQNAPATTTNPATTAPAK